MVAVRQMPAMSEVHAENGVTWTKHGAVCGLISLRSGVRLDVGILGPEQLLSSIAREILHNVHVLAAAVVTPSRIAFGVFIGEDATRRLENGLGGEILAGDEFQARVLTLELIADGIVNLRIGLSQR